MRAPLDVRIHDASISLWQDDARDPSFREEIYGGLIRLLRSHGWSIRRDPQVKRNWPRLSADHRLGARGTMRCAIKVSGRVVKVEFWSLTAEQHNCNGRRYDFEKLRRMHPQEQRRFALACRRIISWAEALAPLTISRGDDRGLSPMQRIEKGYADSWHKDKTLGRPVPRTPGNSQSADGQTIEHGATVWAPDFKGRIGRGVAYYNINNMWWVVAGGQLRNLGCHEIYSSQPAGLRRKRNDRLRRTRLEGQLAKAVKAADDLRAHLLNQILFADQPVHLIWSRKNNAYHAPQYAGYSSDVVTAGRYTRDQPGRERKRVPHILSVALPNRSHVRFDEVAHDRPCQARRAAGGPDAAGASMAGGKRRVSRMVEAPPDRLYKQDIDHIRLDGRPRLGPDPTGTITGDGGA